MRCARCRLGTLPWRRQARQQGSVCLATGWYRLIEKEGVRHINTHVSITRVVWMQRARRIKRIFCSPSFAKWMLCSVFECYLTTKHASLCLSDARVWWGAENVCGMRLHVCVERARKRVPLSVPTPSSSPPLSLSSSLLMTSHLPPLSFRCMQLHRRYIYVKSIELRQDAC
jgi:hypothetical protein